MKNQSGASLIEYALLAALIAVVCIGAVTFLGAKTQTTANGQTVEMIQKCQVTCYTENGTQILNSVYDSVSSWACQRDTHFSNKFPPNGCIYTYLESMPKPEAN